MSLNSLRDFEIDKGWHHEGLDALGDVLPCNLKLVTAN